MALPMFDYDAFFQFLSNGLRHIAYWQATVIKSRYTDNDKIFKHDFHSSRIC